MTFFQRGRTDDVLDFVGSWKKGAVGILDQGLGGESMRFVGIPKDGKEQRDPEERRRLQKIRENWECFSPARHWDGAGGRGQIYSKGLKRWGFLLNFFGKSNHNPGMIPGAC